jgi:hypothetical protein
MKFNDLNIIAARPGYLQNRIHPIIAVPVKAAALVPAYILAHSYALSRSGCSREIRLNPIEITRTNSSIKNRLS